MQLPHELEEWIYKHRTTVSAGSASFVATILGFPLDSVKSRLQVSKYTGVVDCIQKTYRHEGFQGFFRGKRGSLCTCTPFDVSLLCSFRPYDAAIDDHARANCVIHDLLGDQESQLHRRCSYDLTNC